MARSPLDKAFSSANSIDLIVYIRNHPGCRKSDVYHDVTRNVHTLEKLREFRNLGLLDMDETEVRTFMSLTGKGERIAELLEEAGSILDENDGSAGIEE